MKTICFCFLHLVAIAGNSQNESVLISIVNEDSAIAVASHQYSDIPFMRRLLMGKNYRKSWSTPVKFPIFYLSKRGFKIEKLGGGKQTNSLQLRDQNNQLWVLRSIDKDVKKGIPSIFRLLPYTPYKQDIISADYPYAPLVAASLMRASGIPAPEPVYYVVADEEALGEYRSLFANTVCMLEKRDPSFDATETLGTEAMFKKLKESPQYQVLQKQVLKARILDMLIGDPDRHEQQWRWGMIDSGEIKYFYAIPRDRDHVIYFTKGFLPNLAELFSGSQVAFSEGSNDLKNFNKKARNFDKTFLKGLSESDWQDMARTVTLEMSDEVLEAAVQKLPPEIFALDGELIKSRLKARRVNFERNVMDYYHYLFTGH